MFGDNDTNPVSGDAGGEGMEFTCNSFDQDHSNYPPERTERYKRIEPRLRAIKDWMDTVPSPADGSKKNFFQRDNRGPDLNKEDMTLLMRDLKEEGNGMFKDKNYKHAGEFYTHSLIAAKLLQVHHFVETEPEFLSSLFSNRATCCFKMDMFKQAVEDSDYAINMNSNNIKAYFRKAAAFKAMREYSEALSVAEVALQKAKQMGKTQEIIKKVSMDVWTLPFKMFLQTICVGDAKYDGLRNGSVKEIHDLTKEIRSHLSPPFKLNELNPFEGTKPKKNQQQSKSTEVSATAAVKSKNKNGVDESWLEGTAVTTSQSKVPVTKSKKKKKKEQQKSESQVTKSSVGDYKSTAQSSPQKSSYKGRYSAIDKPESSSGSSEQSSADESDDISEPEDSGIGENWSSQVPDDVCYELDYMGLDDFATKSVTTKPKPVPTQPRSVNPDFYTNQYQFQRPPNREQGIWQKVGHPARQTQSVPASKKVTLTDYPFLVPPVPLDYPFDKTYCFTLVCQKCHLKIGEGPNGYRLQPNLVHSCDADTLLIKYRDKTDKDWIKIRPRQNVSFLGKYQLCKTYPNNQDCKVGENKCAFAHFREEIHFWTLDRDGHFDIDAFIQIQRDFLKQGKMKKVLNGKVLEDPGANVKMTMPDVTRPPPPPLAFYPDRKPQGMPGHSNKYC